MLRRRITRSPRLARLRRRRVLTRIFGALAIAGSAALLLYALSRPMFFIREITVGGASRVPEEAVLARIRDGLSETFFGVVPRTHALWYPKAALAQRLLFEFPVLAAVELSLSSPHSLHAELRERAPEALWCMTDSCFFMDGSGFAFSPAPPEAYSKYDRFFAPPEASSTPAAAPFGQQIEGTRMAAIRSFLRALEGLSLAPSSVRLGEGDEFFVVLFGGGELRLRGDGRLSEAISRLQALFSEKDVLPRSRSGEVRIEYIDLRHGNKIYFKPR